MNPNDERGYLIFIIKAINFILFSTKWRKSV